MVKKTTKLITPLLLLLLLISSHFLLAEIKPASPFGDHMVLQQGMPVPVWGTANPSESITVTLGKQKKTIIADKDGKWMIKLDKLKSGGPFEMTISGSNTISLKDIYVGEVWLCSGQSNMDMTVAKEDRNWCGVVNEAEEVASANYPLIRMFDVDFVTSEQPQALVAGKWEVVSPQTIGHLSAVAYFFARDLQKKIKVPIGLITTAFGASTAEAWTSEAALKSHPQLTYLLDEYARKRMAYDTGKVALKKYEDDMKTWEAKAAQAKAEGKEVPKKPKNTDPKKDQHSPYVLYNGMVSPLIPYAIKGALWYQGESNGPSRKVYSEIMETLVKNWRDDWGQGNFPFLYVQLANHNKLSTEPSHSESMTWVREQQLRNLSIPNTAMVVAIDNADPDNPGNIHPKNKQDIGKRLALAARALVYKEKIPYSGPIYEKMNVEGNSIRVQFKHVNGGLVPKGDKLTGFAIAGEDQKFVWADAKIVGESVVISSPEVSKPVAVRYGWAENPPVNLYNKADLPASPFRTDNFDK